MDSTVKNALMVLGLMVLGIALLMGAIHLQLWFCDYIMGGAI